MRRQQVAVSGLVWGWGVKVSAFGWRSKGVAPYTSRAATSSFLR